MEINKVYNKDYLEFMKEIPDRFIDSLITDSPYCSSGFLGSQGLSKKVTRREDFQWFAGDNLSTSGWMWMIRSFMLETNRILKPNSSAFLFTDWRMFPILVPVVESCGFRYKNLIIWDKGRPGLGSGFRPCYEIIVEFSNGKTKYFSKSTGNIIRAPRIRKKLHEAQKPVEIVEKIIETAVPINGLVLDPFVGSGTTAVASKKLGRDFLVNDINPRYVEISNARLQTI